MLLLMSIFMLFAGVMYSVEVIFGNFINTCYTELMEYSIDFIGEYSNEFLNEMVTTEAELNLYFDSYNLEGNFLNIYLNDCDMWDRKLKMLNMLPGERRYTMEELIKEYVLMNKIPGVKKFW